MIRLFSLLVVGALLVIANQTAQAEDGPGTRTEFVVGGNETQAVSIFFLLQKSFRDPNGVRIKVQPPDCSFNVLVKFRNAEDMPSYQTNVPVNLEAGQSASIDLLFSEFTDSGRLRGFGFVEMAEASQTGPCALLVNISIIDAESGATVDDLSVIVSDPGVGIRVGG